MARITMSKVEKMAEAYRKSYGFDPRDGWAQVWSDLPDTCKLSTKLPRAVAYGAYMALQDLLKS